MAGPKKYYWLKLKKDFFKRHDIRIIEDMPNGKEYVLLYLKLLVERISHEGCLRFSDTIPYNEQMISTITNTNIDIVRTAMKLFEQLHMIELLDDETIYMSEVNNLVGVETEWAKKKRIYREKQSLIEDRQKTVKGLEKDIVRQEKEIEKEIEIDKDIKSIVQNDCTKKVKKAEIDSFFESVWKLYPTKRGKGQVSDAKKKKLYEVGYENLKLAIQRYTDELSKEEWRKPQNGSTFFNSGYIDYLGDNYQPSTGQVKSKNKFNQFPQRNYTMEQMSDIERKLINKGLEEREDDN